MNQAGSDSTYSLNTLEPLVFMGYICNIMLCKLKVHNVLLSYLYIVIRLPVVAILHNFDIYHITCIHPIT